MLKRLFLFIYLAFIGFCSFSQSPLDSIFESIKYPEVPHNKSLVYFIWPKLILKEIYPLQTVSYISSTDTIMLTSLFHKEYSYCYFDPGEISLIHANTREQINLSLEPNKKYYLNLKIKDSSPSFSLIENSVGDEKLPKLTLSSHLPWVVLFYEVDQGFIADTNFKRLPNDEREGLLNNYLKKSKYVTGKLLGVSRESYFIESKGKIIEFDNLECKSIFFLEAVRLFNDYSVHSRGSPKYTFYLPYSSFSSPSLASDDYLKVYNMYLSAVYNCLSEKSTLQINRGLLFRGTEFIQYLFFFNTFYNYMYNGDEIDARIQIHSENDYFKVKDL